jgi:hypothetical protein
VVDPAVVDRRDGITRRQRDELVATIVEDRIRLHQECTGALPWITRVMREQQGGHRETGQDPLMTDDGDDELALS